LVRAGDGLRFPVHQLRRMQISEFSTWLRMQTNKHKRPFQEETIRGYAETAGALDLWMAEEDIRMLTEGVRREELAQQPITYLSGDSITRPLVRVVPLKGARDSSKGRLVPLMMTSAQALTDYLRVRRSHKMARLPALWLGSRNRGPMTGSGVYQMLDRRAEEAGYDPQAVHPHMFRHTVANDWLAGGGSEGDLMRLMGWHDRSMVDRYAADMQDQRAFDAKRRRGDMY
jgi:integrase